MSARIWRHLSSPFRKSIPNTQQLIDGAARFVSLLLIYSMSVSTGTAVGIVLPDGGRNWSARSHFEDSAGGLSEERAAPTSIRDARQESVQPRMVAGASPLTESKMRRGLPVIHAMLANAAVAQSAPAACLYALDPSAQRAFAVSGSTSISTACSVVVESSASPAFEMDGTETLYLQNHAQVGVVGGSQLTGQTRLVDTISNLQVQPVKITSPGDPLAFLPAPTQGTIVGKSHTSYDMNSRPANNTLLPGVYCGGLTVGNTNGTGFTMSPGTYIMAGGGLTINSLASISGSGVTVYNTSSIGWGCSQSYSYTPITVSGQANVTMSAPSSGALAGVVLFGDRAGCTKAGSCQDQISGGASTTFNGAMYFKSDTLLFSGNNSSSGCMTAVADMININGNSSMAVTGCSTIGGVSVSLTPTSATLSGGLTQQFSASVANTNNTAVSWSVSPSGTGSISTSGLYTAPATVATQQTVTITAISQADPTKSASATLTLTPAVSVSLAPATVTLYSGQTQQFSASVANTSNTAVSWSMSPAGSGTISTSGLYTAPTIVATQQTVTITAKSQADPTRSASATVTLMPAVAVSITPATATINAGQSQQFSATVANTSNTAVNWSISPSGSGTISAAGLYTVPTNITKQQTVIVRVTSQADATKSASATVTVNVPVPLIATISPAAAAPGSPITIAGQNFLSTPGTVTLNDVALPTTSWNNSSISLLVPSNNCTGPVVVTTQYGSSNAATLTISGTQMGCMNPLPIANAGPAQTVSVSASVQLDGTGSTDQTGSPLTYRWSFVSIPSGSVAVLSSPTTPKPAFVADVYGQYTAQLVVNDSYHNSAPSQVVISTRDSAPVANAGPNQTVPTLTLVQLNGGASTDVDGNPLTYSWSFVSLPANSQATLTNPTSVSPKFTTDKKGTYIVQLVVNDGQLNSVPSTVTIGDVNTPPIANPGPNQSVQIGATVQLNGSASTDVDGDSLTYRWSILSAPAGSMATLSSASLVNPTWIADVPGNFVMQLIVNDGTVDSTPATVTIGNQDIAPVANAGAGQKVAVGALVSLDGTGSSDSDSKPLTYLWSILSAPAESQASLTSTTAPNPAFTVDKYGNYVVQLTVNDGYLSSAPATATISTIYTLPVANPGPAQSVATGTIVSLTGAASTSNDGYSLTYKWSMLLVPTGSAATLSNPTSVAPTFVADVTGAYVAQLIVNDGVSDSIPKTVMITAAAPNQAPVVSAGPDQTAYSPNAVTLSGAVTDDGQPAGAMLSVQWELVSGPGIATFTKTNSATTTVTFDQTGTYVLRLSASDTLLTSSSTCTVTYLSAQKKPPIVNAGSAQTVLAPNNLPLQGSVISTNTPKETPSVQWSVVSTTPAGLPVTFSDVTSPTSTVNLPKAGTYVLLLTGTEAGLSASSTVTITTQQGGRTPVVNAGPDQVTQLPNNTVTLEGTASDPASGVMSFAWVLVEGPGAVSLGNSSALTSSATFSTAGTYVFRLTAASAASRLTGSATTRVTVYGQDLPPVVSAGPNQTITLPINTVQLNGSATQSGVLEYLLAFRWTEVSGPAAVSFANAKSASTVVVFPQAGTYLLCLTASDSQLQASANVTVVVNPSGGGANLSLTPSIAGPDVVSTSQVLTAVLKDKLGVAITGTQIQFTVNGANTNKGSAITDGTGTAVFTYTGVNSGTDTVQAIAGLIISNSASVSWIVPAQSISTSPVVGTFFTSDGSGVFDTPPSATPVFSQTFPVINFNPPYQIQVWVDGRTLPWLLNGGINAAYPYILYSDTNALNPVSFAVVPGQTLNVTYVSGLWSIYNPIGTQYGSSGNGLGSWDANGSPGTNAGNGAALPSANSALLIGGFADATGQVVSPGPLLIGNSFSAIVPPGATQLLLGMNDGNAWSDNSGAVLMNVRTSALDSSGVGVNTHPFTDVTTDASGNVTGSIVAQGNGVQAGGVGPLYAFQSTFTGTFTVPNAGDVSLNIFSNAGFIFGVGNGASRVSGPLVNPPSTGFTAFANLPVMGAYNAAHEAGNVVVIHFPAAGTYPYELDYAESGAGGDPINLSLDHLSLTMTVWQTNPTVVPPSTGSLALSPQVSTALDTGQVQTISVNALDITGVCVGDLPVELVISGANEQELLAVTNIDGIAVFSYIGNNAGIDTIEAISNISGQRTLSNIVNVPWNIPAGGSVPQQPNQPPTVSAGVDQEIMLPHTATFNGTVTDDGLPLGASLTQSWSQVSGPGIAGEYAFEEAVVLDHTKVPNTDQVDFPILFSGTYPFLKSVVNGGHVQSANGWDIIFTSDIAGQNKLDHEIDSYNPITGAVAFWVRIPTLSHTADTTIYMWYGNNAIEVSQENVSGVWKNQYLSVYHLGDGTTVGLNDSSSSGYTLEGAASAVPGMFGGGVAFSGTDYLYHDSVVAYPVGESSVTLETWVQKISGRGDILGYGDNTGPGSRDALYFGFGMLGMDFCGISATAPLPSDLDWGSWHHLVAVYTGGDLSTTSAHMYVDGAPLATSSSGGTPAITTSEFVIGGIPGYDADFTGSVDEVRVSFGVRSADWVAAEYNNQFSPSTFYKVYSIGGKLLTYSNGASLVTFSNPGAPVTQATFGAPGTYVLQLSASDTQYESASRVVVTVSPYLAPNQPPMVSAGPSQTVTLPNSITLTGSVSDDGLPNGATVTGQWSLLSGPVAVSFGNAHQPSTSVTFTQAGSYVLQLSASDTQYTSTATTTIVVNAATGTGNQPPVVSANPALTAVAGISVALNGAATDDGLPNGTLSVQWTQLSGPGIASFANANTASSQVTFSTAGTYVLQLAATDSQYTSSLTLTVPVLDAAPSSGSTNQPPTVNAGVSQSISLPTDNVSLSGLVKDDGLPSNQLSIAWTEISGPAPVVFSNPYAASTQATFSTAGVYLLQLSANDGQYTTNSTTTVVVNPVSTGGAIANQAPTLSVSAPGTVVLPNAVVTFSSVAADDGLPVGSTLSLLWSQVSGPASAVIAMPNQAATQVTFSKEGDYVFKLIASDSELTTTATFSVSVESQPGPLPSVQISLPDGSDIKSSTAVTGTVSAGSWTLSYAPISASGAAGAYQTFAAGTGPSSGTLGTLDPSGLVNGAYSILLTTQDQWGQTAQSSAGVSVDGNLKLGAFSIAFQDLSVPLPGLPITVTRTYDSRDRSLGDFGDGWRLSLSNIRVQKYGGALGQGWDEEVSWQGVWTSYCLQVVKNHAVTATFPDGRVYRFSPSTSVTCQTDGPLTAANMIFTQVATGSSTAGAKLETLDGGEVLIAGSIPGAVDLSDYSGNYYDATQFKLTTADGYVYYLDQSKGATKVVDPNGNSLIINSDGVVSSSGASVAFSRDGQGRISSVSDPSGALISYAYNSSGDLTSVTDRAQNETTFGYDNNHYLTTIKDPRGVSALKNTYDGSGRLLSTTDANGNSITYAPNLAANREQITDRLGNVTLYEYDNDGNITRKTDAAGNITSFTYDSNDNQLSQSVYLGTRALTTSYTYDATGNKLSETDPLGNTTKYTYNSFKQVLSVTDALGHVTSNVYDGHGNLTSTTDPNGKVTSYSYNSNGTVASVTDPLKGNTSFTYDGEGNLTGQADASGNSSSFTYDANNNKLSQTVTRTLANGTTQKLLTSYEYDSNNRLTKTHLPDGTYTEVHYNSIGKQDQTGMPSATQPPTSMTMTDA